MPDQDPLAGVEFGVSAQDQGAAVGGGEADIEHLDVGELVEHGARREAAGERHEPGAQRHVQAIGHEGDEDVRLDAALQLMIDGAQPEIVLEVLEGGPISVSWM